MDKQQGTAIGGQREGWGEDWAGCKKGKAPAWKQGRVAREYDWGGWQVAEDRGGGRRTWCWGHRIRSIVLGRVTVPTMGDMF